MYPDFILHKLKAGDKEAFEFIFRQYYQGLVVFALDFVPDKDKAEEIVQGIFVKLWEEKDKIVITSSVKSYLFRAVQNKCLDHIKHDKIQKKYEKDLMEKNLTSKTDNDILTFELKERIENAIEDLPENIRKVFRMSRYENKKYNEIAKAMNISVKTVEARIGKALAILRHDLKDWL